MNTEEFKTLLNRIDDGDNQDIFEQILKAFEDKDKEIEKLQIQLAGCGVAALQNTEESIRDRITSGNEYYSASYQDVCDAVDREIELRKQIAELKCCGNCKYENSEEEYCYTCSKFNNWEKYDEI